MMKINENFLKLDEDFLFSNIAKKKEEYMKAHPGKRIISLGIGDVTRPLTKSVVNALQFAVNEMADEKTFRGYGPEQGYIFLRKAIKKYYKSNNIILDESEIFINDGAKSDLGNILDIFDSSNVVLIPNPVYPVYVDTNMMAGRKIIFSEANKENGFLPLPDYNIDADIIYLCSPNNPTGATYNKSQLAEWVKYALEKKAIILFDAAYEAFVEGKNMARSIFEIEGAKMCAIEFCSLSKTAGFTGLRCGYSIVPMELGPLNHMWKRRHCTKFNGVPYIVQRAALAVFNNMDEVKENIKYYKENAKIIMRVLDEMHIWYTGGINSPYIWIQVPNGQTSWEFFDYLLEEINVVGTPGIGFGKEGFFRLTAFGNRKDTIEAVKRLKKIFKSDDEKK